MRWGLGNPLSDYFCPSMSFERRRALLTATRASLPATAGRRPKGTSSATCADPAPARQPARTLAEVGRGGGCVARRGGRSLRFAQGDSFRTGWAGEAITRRFGVRRTVPRPTSPSPSPAPPSLKRCTLGSGGCGTALSPWFGRGAGGSPRPRDAPTPARSSA
jgi:hypothetical protein